MTQRVLPDLTKRSHAAHGNQKTRAGRRTVAWMKCNGIREHTSHQTPDSASCIQATGWYVAPSSTRCCCVQQASFDLEMELPGAPALAPFCDQLALLFHPLGQPFPPFSFRLPQKATSWNIMELHVGSFCFKMFRSRTVKPNVQYSWI